MTRSLAWYGHCESVQAFCFIHTKSAPFEEKTDLIKKGDRRINAVRYMQYDNGGDTLPFVFDDCLLCHPLHDFDIVPHDRLFVVQVVCWNVD